MAKNDMQKKSTLLHGINDLNWSSDAITWNILLGERLSDIRTTRKNNLDVHREMRGYSNLGKVRVCRLVEEAGKDGLDH